jgi:symplekin
MALTVHSDALLVTATLNALGVLIQRRPVVANKILSSVLNFNPLKLANSPMTPKNKVLLRSLERTTRALLVNVMKRYVSLLHTPTTAYIHRNPENPANGRIQQYLERMHRMRVDVFDETNRKRPAPVEPNDGLDPAKRQRLGATVPAAPPPIPPLPPGPVSFRQLYTLNPDSSTANFDVQVFQDKNQLIQILLPVLASIDEKKLATAVNVGTS